jgi:hypothetical protein
MEIEYFGGNAVKIKQGGESIGVDLSVPGSTKLAGGAKDLKAVFFTDTYRAKLELPEGVKRFEMAGEYEIGPFSVRGASVKAQGDVYKTEKSNVFLVDPGDFGPVGVISYATPELSGEAMELLANARVLIVPVGGGGLSLDPEDALKIVKELNAEFVIPVHFDDGKTKYDVPQTPVEKFVQLTGSEPDTFEGKVVSKNLVAGVDSFKVVVINPA